MKNSKNSPGSHMLSISQLVPAVVLSVVCGCATAPPSQEEQRQAATSHWITVECEAPDGEASVCLDQDDLNAITNSVPTISTFVVERVRIGKIESDNAQAEAKVCSTRPEYLRLLEEGAQVKVQRGRFLESIEAEESATIVVLSDRLAKELFPDAVDPVGQSVVLKRRQLTVVGVVTDGASWGSAVTRDAYVPLKLFEAGSDQSAPFPYDRFRFRVKTLDQVDATQKIIQNIIQRRPKDRGVRVRSFLAEKK